jgi:predicted alpha/beta-fold hydrolase
MSNREVLRTPDGGQFAIHWDNLHQATRKQLVLIMPGMDGRRNKITNHLLNVAKQLGCITAVISYRGTEISLLTPRFYTISNCDDLDLVVKHIKSKYPGHALFAVGYSYGE